VLANNISTHAVRYQMLRPIPTFSSLKSANTTFARHDFPRHGLDHANVTRDVFARADRFTACAAGGHAFVRKHAFGHPTCLVAAPGVAAAAARRASATGATAAVFPGMRTSMRSLLL